MATQVITNHEMDVLEPPAYSGSLPRLLECIDTEELVEDKELSVSTSRALAGARSVLVALVAEGGVAFAAFFVWMVVRSLR